MIPTSIIRVWFPGLFSWILLGLGIYLSHKWYEQAWSYDLNLQRSYFDPHVGYNRQTLLLFLAGCLLFLVVAGGLIVRGVISLLTNAKNPKAVDQLPAKSREGAGVSQLGRPDGSQYRGNDHPHILSFLPESIEREGEGYRSGADDLHQPSSNHQHGGSFYRLGTSRRRSAATSDDVAVTAIAIERVPERLEMARAPGKAETINFEKEV
jgi:hypothetical protein